MSALSAGSSNTFTGRILKYAISGTTAESGPPWVCLTLLPRPGACADALAASECPETLFAPPMGTAWEDTVKAMAMPPAIAFKKLFFI